MFLNLFLAPGDGLAIALIIVAVLALVIVAASIKIVPQATAFVIEKLGSYHTTWGAGIHFLVPFFFRISKKISLKEQVIDFDPQPVITKDNVTMQIDTVVFFQITDPKAFSYGVDRPVLALEKLTATTLRNIIGDIELDTTLTSRDLINTKMRSFLDDATDPWGIKVNRVELKNILPPKDIRDAMEKQMRAERERREEILRAEGKKQSQILQAEGFKHAQILEAEARRTAKVEEAEGEARAILLVNEATAKGLEMIKKVGLDEGLLVLKSFEAWKDISNGQSTKLIVPASLEGLTGVIGALSEVTKLKNEK